MRCTWFEVCVALFVGLCCSVAGPFQNLDFEAGKLTPVPGRVAFSCGHSAGDALPGWRVFVGPNEFFTVGYDSLVQNALSDESAALSLISNDFMYFQIHPWLVEGIYGFYCMNNHISPWS